MSALSTPGGGATTAQSKPTSGKQKYQKLDINSLYCANKNESSEPSSVKSQLSRKHGMQSLGKVPSARRPPANLPSLKTETGQDPNANSVTAPATSVPSPPICNSQTIPASTGGSAAAGGGWGALPPPTSPHFRTEFPSLEAAAQPPHRAPDHAAPGQPAGPQLQLRPQTEGSWTSGGSAGGAAAATPAAAAASPASQQIPALRNSILPSFLMKGSGGSGGGGSGGATGLGALGGLSALSSRAGGGGGGTRAPRQPPPPRAEPPPAARPILRDDEISSLDDIARDAGWAQNDDIDYDQKLDFSDGESPLPAGGKGRASGSRLEAKSHDGDEEQLWAERRQKQSNEVAAAVARARQRKEDEQRRQQERPERQDVRDPERFDSRDSREPRDTRERRERPDTRDRDRDRQQDAGDKEARSERERDRHDSRGERMERDRFDRNRDRADRDADRDRDFRDNRDRDFRDSNNPAFSKTFQQNIPPRFLKQQQSRQQDDNKGWSSGFNNNNNNSGGGGGGQQGNNKQPPRRQEPPSSYNAPRHAPHARRSYPREYSDREDDFRRDKESGGPQWRSEMQDYERGGRELERQNSKESYHSDHRREDRKSSESAIDHSSRTSAADKLSEVFERKSVGLVEPFATAESAQAPAERRHTPPAAAAAAGTAAASLRDSAERDFGGKASWADAALEEQSTYTLLKAPQDKCSQKPDLNEQSAKESSRAESEEKQAAAAHAPPPAAAAAAAAAAPHKYAAPTAPPPAAAGHHTSFCDNQTISKPSISKPVAQNDLAIAAHVQKQPSTEQPPQGAGKPIFSSQKSEKDFSESESVASKCSTDPATITKIGEKQTTEPAHAGVESQKRAGGAADDKRAERFAGEQANKIPGKEPVERKSSGSGSEKKGRGYGGGGGGAGGFAVYNNRGWGPRDTRGRRHRSGRDGRDARASESDGSTDGAPAERRRRTPRAAPAKQEPGAAPAPETREPFAPRGQPSRRGRGGFQGAGRPPAPAPAKRVAGYGPPNTKSPFGHAARAVRDDELKETAPVAATASDGKQPRPPPPGRGEGGRGRERRPKGAPSGEDDNWETTSEHSEGGTARRRDPGSRPRGARAPHAGARGSARPGPTARREAAPGELADALADLKLTGRSEEVVDDGFQLVGQKKTPRDPRAPQVKDDSLGPKQPRSHSNQGAGRNGSSTRNAADKPNARGQAPVAGKPGAPQYERPRQSHLAPRFVKQRQKQQMGLAPGFGPDAGAAPPPPPPVNAWDKPISQSLRGAADEPPPERLEHLPAPAVAGAPLEPGAADKAGVLDGTTPPVETIIFENTNYKSAPPAEALKQKYQPGAGVGKPHEEAPAEAEARQLAYNGEARAPPRTIQELIDGGRPGPDDAGRGLQMSFEAVQKAEDSSDMKLDFAFDSDLGQLTEDKSAKSLGMARGVHMSASSTISPLAADLNLKIASVKKVWEMPAVAEGGEELQFAGFEEVSVENAPPNVCKVKPTQQLQSPPPQHYNHVGYQGGYGGLSVPSPPAVLFNSSQQLLGSAPSLQQQGGLYGAFLESRGQFGGFPGAPYNYQPPPDMFQSLPSQYRMAAAGGAAGFGQTGQLGNSPSTVLISSTSNSLMSASVKPTSQQIGAIGSKGGGPGGVGPGVNVGVGVGGVNTYQQQYLGYSGPVGDSYSLPSLLPRAAPPANSYYSPYQPAAAPAPPSYPLQFPAAAQSVGGGFGSQFLSASQLQVHAAVQQMQQQQYRQPLQQPLQQQYAPPPQRPQPQQLKSPLHEHANGFAPLCDSHSPTPKGAPTKVSKGPHSPPQHKYQHPPPNHHQQQQQQQQQQHQQQQHHQQQQQQHHHHQQQQHHHQQQVNQMIGMGNSGRVGNNGGGMSRGNMAAPRYHPAPIQRPLAPHAHPHHAHYRAAVQQQQQQQRRPPQQLYYQHQTNGGVPGGGGVCSSAATEAEAPAGAATAGGAGAEPSAAADEAAAAPEPAAPEAKPE